ncbi:hydantoinase B/oxoprolinase family protein [Natronolimnohabitans innermongolicus]|uniref:N-methylhydantoinase B 2 n=1 Tax=Natronolimnohabitans innermongolicus JCM 12255 TaxID=1227499 RepID=L9WQE6_9EURY|nr:hydantoinase B/oxoprolinase family protein [Natronolimnohabitans innermongolicus]ELY51709.1 N-methylhydantoinase B 2 [Natronolimnohabitans innermongolicus JCM 12255]
MSDTATPDFVGDHDVDQTTLDIIESTLSNTRHEMDRVVETTAISPVIREQSDQFPLIADAQGRMVMGQFGSAIDTILENSPFDRDDLNDGDVIATNDPYACAGAVSHTPDMLLLRPIFYEGDLVGFSSQWGNLMDVGGKTPGSMPVQATTIFEEGMRLPPVKLYKEGEFDSELLETFAHNTRLPEHAEADIKALAAGTKAAETRVHELCDRFGKETYVEACDAILDRTRAGMIDLIHEFVPEGERYTFEDYVDDDGMGNGPIKLHLEIYREGDTVYLDWTGTDEQVPGTVNFLLNEQMFKMFTGVFLIMAFDPLLTFNDGYYDLFEVTLPQGSVVQPEFPAALGNRLPLMARQFDVLQATFSKLIDGFSVAGSYGTSPNLVYAGTDSEGNDFQMLEILYGGIPARPGGDGLDGHSWWPLFRTVPAEYQEAYYPLTIDEYSTRADTGGAGEFRGGHGITKVYTFEAEGAITFQDDRAHTYPWGVDGGKHAQTSEKKLLRTDGTEEELPSKVENVPVSAGDKLVFSTAGGGGLGDPLERDPAVVAKEVERGLVTESAASDEYGVVLADDGGVDEAATADRREELRSERDEPAAFDYGPLPDDADLEERIAAERREFEDRHD